MTPAQRFFPAPLGRALAPLQGSVEVMGWSLALTLQCRAELGLGMVTECNHHGILPPQPWAVSQLLLLREQQEETIYKREQARVHRPVWELRPKGE